MREIKFRARFEHRGKSEFVYFTLDDLSLINRDSMTGKEYKILNHDPRTRQQYTGFKDKSGREIYEGDIVEVYDEEEIIENIGQVEWLNRFGMWNITKHKMGLGDTIQEFYVEVIGNIYENPELK